MQVPAAYTRKSSQEDSLQSSFCPVWGVAPPLYTPVMNHRIFMKYYVHYDCTKGLSFVTLYHNILVLMQWSNQSCRYFFINILMSSNFFEYSFPVPHTTPAKMHQDAVGYSLNWRPGLSRTWNTSTRWCPSNINKWHNIAQCLVLFSPTKVSLETRG